MKVTWTEVFVHNLLCCFGLQGNTEHVACQHTDNCAGIFMATGGLGESTNQIHGDEFHGHGSWPEIVLDVLSLLHLQLCTHLAMFAMHKYIFLHSFPVVQPLECCISSPEPIVTSVVMCEEQGCADQAVREYYWFKVLQIV